MEETNEINGQGETADINGAGSVTQTTPVIERGDQVAERLEKATEALRVENDRQERIQAHAALGGRSEAGMEPTKEEPISDIEYAKRVARGEINPLKEDGFI